jgi:hypothetical protein
MGIKKLFTFLNNNKLYDCYPYLNNLLDEYNYDKSATIVGVDANLFCYKYMHSYDNMLIGFFNQIIKFLSNKIIPLYIFDGGVLPEKEFTNNIRNNKKFYNKMRLDMLNKIIEDKNCNYNELLELKKKYEKNSIKINNDYINLLLELLDLLNIPYIFSFTEGDYLAVLLNKYKIIDFFLTDDTDPIPAGIDNVIKFYNNNVYYLNTLKVYNTFKFSKEQFCDFCILLGNDYRSFHHSIKPSEIYNLIEKYKSIENILKYVEIKNINLEDLEIINKIRMIYGKGYLNEKNKFLELDKKDFFKYENLKNLSNIFIEYWDEYIEILKIDIENKKLINENSLNLKKKIISLINEKKFNSNKIIKFIKKNIPDINNNEIKNIIVTFEYLNNLKKNN